MRSTTLSLRVVEKEKKEKTEKKERKSPLKQS